MKVKNSLLLFSTSGPRIATFNINESGEFLIHERWFQKRWDTRKPVGSVHYVWCIANFKFIVNTYIKF